MPTSTGQRKRTAKRTLTVPTTRSAIPRHANADSDHANCFPIPWVSLAGCGGGNDNKTDAAVQIDAVTPDCDSYCTVIQANCTGPNAQYAGVDSDAARQSCKQTCASFAAGASVDETSGNTLGCRLHYALDASNPAAAPADCAYAGPAGDAIMAPSPAFCSGGDACTSFCAIEIKACGSRDQPLPGDPTDETNNSIYQYRNMGTCIASCQGFDKTHAYAPSARGNSLACRLYQATQAVISVMPDGVTFCRDTATPPIGRCDGPATP